MKRYRIEISTKGGWPFIKAVADDEGKYVRTEDAQAEHGARVKAEQRAESMQRHFDEAGDGYNLLALLDLYNDRRIAAERERDELRTTIEFIEANNAETVLALDESQRIIDALCKEMRAAYIDGYTDGVHDFKHYEQREPTEQDWLNSVTYSRIQSVDCAGEDHAATVPHDCEVGVVGNDN